MILPTLSWVSESEYGTWTGYVGAVNPAYENVRIHFSQHCRDAKPICNLFVGGSIVHSF